MRTASLVVLMFGSLGSVVQAMNLVVGVEDIPYSPYYDFNTTDARFSRVLLDQFAADTGHTITYVPLPIKQFSKWLLVHDIDFKFPDNKRWLAPGEEGYPANYYSHDIVYLRAGTAVLKINQNRPEAQFKIIGKITGFDPTLWRDKIASGEVKVLEDTSPKVLTKHLAMGNIDGVDIDIGVINYYLHELNIQAEVAYHDTLGQTVFGYQLSTNKYPEVIEQFNQWLANNQDYVNSLKQRFDLPDEKPE
jgi:polar amino acid transport system substrate-binding protein